MERNQPFPLVDPLAAGQIDPAAFIAHTAALVGDVRVGAHSSIWFGAVLRGDLAPIVVGQHTSIQDGAVIHVDDGCPAILGDHITVGHGAIVHGCTIEDRALIGVRAMILSRAHIGANSIIGACALVTEDMHVPPNSVVLGVPGKVVGSVTEVQEGYLQYARDEYVALCQAYKQQRPDLDQTQSKNRT